MAKKHFPAKYSAKTPSAKPHMVTQAYMASRSVPLMVDESGKPASLDEVTRSVEVVAATEEPTLVFDWDRWEVVPEVLLMSGCRIPASRQCIFLDTHSRDSVSRVLGSFRGADVVEAAHGPSLSGRTHYSSVAEGESAFTKVKEGHVTDVSVGYEVNAHIWVKEGETTTVEGKTFSGPLRIATDWTLKELSLCPIGADDKAKIRNAQPPAQGTTPVAPANEAAGHNKHHKEKAMAKSTAAGGTMSATRKKNPSTITRSSLITRLRTLLGLRGEEEDEEKRENIDLVDDEGNPIAPAEMTEEELITVVEELEDALAEAEEELDDDEARSDNDEEEERQSGSEDSDNSEEDPEGDKVRKRSSRRAKSSARSGIRSFASLSPKEAARAERARVMGIRNLAKAHNLPFDMEEKLINRGVSLTRAKAQVLDMRTQHSSTGPGFFVSTGLTEKDKFRSAVQDSLLLRCGHSLEKPAPGATELQSHSLRELSREMLVRSGQPASGNIVQIVGRALATTDLPNLLVETSRRTLMEAFEMAPETWKTWAGTGIATDFKKSTAVGMEGEVKPVLKPEGGEYQEGKLAENAEEYKIATYGRKMVITREAIINDDLNALTALPRMYGEQTAEMVGDVAYDALLSPKNIMGDGVALFHASHNNLYAGAGGVPTVASLGKVVTGMKLQKDSFGKTVTIQPKFFIAPVALEVDAEQFFNTQLQGAPVIGTGTSPLVNNPYGGNFFTRVYDRRLDEAGAGDWILAAQRATVVVFFLGGVEAPYIEDQINFDNDAVESKVRMDVGAKAMRWVTLAMATKE